MKSKLTMMVAMAAACAAIQLVAMPTEEETRKSEPVVKKMLAQERAALESGKKTRSEVAVAAMKLADEAETDAAKLLLMKGAFVLYVRDGNLEKAVETMNALKATIPDIPPQSVTNIIEIALCGVSKENCGELHKLLDEAMAEVGASGAIIGAFARGSDTHVAPAASATSIGEYKFNYKLDENGNAVLCGEPCVSPKPEGVLVVPDKIDGHMVTKIGNIAFKGCDKVTRIVLPPHLEDILKTWVGGTNPGCIFEGCFALESIEISKANPNYTSENGALYTKDKKRLIAYPKNRSEITLARETTIVGGGAFLSCLFNTAKIPVPVEQVGFWAFRSCPNLEVVEFPKSVNWVGPYAFYGCNKMKTVVFHGDAPAEIHRRTKGRENLFYASSKNIVVEVEKDSKGWKSKDSTELPERWPKTGSDSRPIRYIGEEERSSVASILKGMIKVPGRDYWLSATEVTQGQWEFVMGNNPSSHKGANLPVENVSRDDCDVFLEKLNQTKEVKASQFEFRLPELEEWKYAAWAGSAGHGSWIKSGIVGDVLDMAWVEANSSNQTHAVATKAPNAFGFYDMLGNVWEWLSGDAPEGGRGALKGCAFNQVADKCTWNKNWYMPKTQRNCCCGLRLAAHVRPQPALMTSGATEKTEVAARKSEAERVGVPTQKMSVTAKSESDESKKNEMKLPYEVVDGAVVLRSRGLQSRRKRRDDQKSAVVKISSGELVIPDAIDGIPVRSIGYGAFSDCKGLTAVTIPSSVTNIYDIAFSRCGGIKSFSVASENPSYSSRNGLLCTKDGATLVAGVIGVNGNVTIPNSVTTIGRAAFFGRSGLKNVTIPSSVTGIVANAFSDCNGITSFSVDASNVSYSSRNGMLCTKDGATLVAGVIGVNGNVTIPNGVTTIGWSAFSGQSGLKSVTIPNGVTNIGSWAFHDCRKLTSVRIPEGVTSIGADAFLSCSGLTSVRIPNSVTSVGVGAFGNCSALKSVTMCGERPNVPNSLLPNNIFGNCGKLKSIHVPAKAKSWAGMKEWQGIPLVFDGEDAGRQAQAEHGAERQAAESAQRQAAAERKEQLRQLEQIQEELRRQREAKQAEK